MSRLSAFGWLSPLADPGSTPPDNTETRVFRYLGSRLLAARGHGTLSLVVRIHRNCAATIVIDDRYPPLLISTFIGSANIDAAAWHEREHRGALLTMARRHSKVIRIHDATLSERPSPDARKFWADAVKHTPDEVKRATLASFVVLDSALLRGAITAIGWMSGEMRGLQTFKTLTLAMESGLKLAAETGLSRPDVPAPYQLPREAGLSSRSAKPNSPAPFVIR